MHRPFRFRRISTAPRRGVAGPAVAATALVTILLSSSCGVTQGSGDTSDPQPQRSPTTMEPDDPPVTGGKLVVAVPGDVNGWNPCINQWSDGGSLMGPSMLEPLVLLDANGEPQPYLAESWSPSPDFSSWTITVRDGIRFHNGQILDASSMKRSIEALSVTGLTSMLFGQNYDRTEVTGPRTVTVHLRGPQAQYGYVMSATYMMAPEMLDREDQGTVQPIGTGPFRFGRWDRGKSLEVVRWDGYWRKDANGRALPYLDRIDFRIVPDEGTREGALVSGDADLALTTSPGTASRLDAGSTVLRDYKSQRTLIILQTAEGPDNAPNPFTNVHARRALAYATERTAVARSIGEAVETSSQARSPDSMWGMPESDTGYPSYDPAAARREIDLYRTETGRDALRFRLLGLPASQDQALMQMVIEQWKQVGIDATTVTMDQVPMNTTIVLGRWHATLARVYGGPNPAADYLLLDSANTRPVGELSINFTRYHSDTIDRYLQADRTSKDMTTRRAAVLGINRELNEQVINIWLFNTPYAIVARRRVRGLNDFRTHPFGNYTPKPWWGQVWYQR